MYIIQVKELTFMKFYYPNRKIYLFRKLSSMPFLACKTLSYSVRL